MSKFPPLNCTTIFESNLANFTPQSLVYPCVFARFLDVSLLRRLFSALIHVVVVNGFLPTLYIVVPGRQSSTPSGSPASSARTAKRRLADGLLSLGLIIMTLPVASAGAVLRAMVANGFHSMD